jgi:outer membrane receptor protein involved in Fe transport
MRVGEALNVGVNYTYLDATYRSTETVDGSANSSNDQATAGFPGVEGTITIQPGNRIPLIPRQILKLFADYQLSPAWSLGADVAAVGSSFARGNENNQHQPDGVYYLGSGRNPGYAVLNLSADYRPTPKWALFAQINNVLDRKYSSAAQLGATAFDANGNFLARPFPADANGDRPLQNSTFYSPGAPRSFRVGVKYSFDG